MANNINQENNKKRSVDTKEATAPEVDKVDRTAAASDVAAAAAAAPAAASTAQAANAAKAPKFASDDNYIASYKEAMKKGKSQTQQSIHVNQTALFNFLKKVINSDPKQFKERWTNILKLIGSVDDSTSAFFLRYVSRRSDDDIVKLLPLGKIINIIIVEKSNGKDKVSSLLALNKDLEGVANEDGLLNMSNYYG